MHGRSIAAAATAAAAAATILAIGWRRRRHEGGLPVPVIDISRFAHGGLDERRAVAAEWDDALRTVGFCLLTGYEELLPTAVIERARSDAREFFALPAAEKARAHVDGTVGYIGLGGENVGASAGMPTAAPDPVESLNLAGYQDDRPWRAEVAEAECPWRESPWVPPCLVDALSAYWGGATALMLQLMALSELALQLPAGTFAEAYRTPGTLLRLAWYPPTSAAIAAAASAAGEQALRYGAHTDFDGFTILHREAGEEEGLEIERGRDDWVSVPAPPGTLTINIGDLLARWTNDRWRATRHRVAAPRRADRGRLSVVYFTGPHPDTTVRCLPSPLLAGEPERYAPITAYEHVLQKMEAATASPPDPVAAANAQGAA